MKSPTGICLMVALLFACKPVLVHQGPFEAGTETATLQAVQYLVSSYGPNTISQIKAINPYLKILQYQKSCFFPATISVPENFYWKYPDGSYVIEAGYGNRMLRITDPAVQDLIVNYWVEQSSAADGVMVDNIEYLYDSRFESGVPPDFDHEVFYQAQKSMLQKFRAASSKHLNFNGYSDTVYPGVRVNNLELAEYADSVSFEGLLYKIVSGEYYGQARVQQRMLDFMKIDLVSMLESLQNVEDYQKRCFAYSTYLILRNEKSSFSFVTGNPMSIYWPEYTLDLGAWVGNYQINGDVIFREYKKGLVGINLTDHPVTIDLGKTYQKYVFTGGGSVNNQGTVSLEQIARVYTFAPQSGLIVKK